LEDALAQRCSRVRHARAFSEHARASLSARGGEVMAEHPRRVAGLQARPLALVYPYPSRAARIARGIKGLRRHARSRRDVRVRNQRIRVAAYNWSTGEAKPVELPLDPARGAREQVDALFKRARRLKLGAAIAGKRLAEAEQGAARLEAVSGRLADAGEPARRRATPSRRSPRGSPSG
jgi:hypothetical protein